MFTFFDFMLPPAHLVLVIFASLIKDINYMGKLQGYNSRENAPEKMIMDWLHLIGICLENSKNLAAVVLIQFYLFTILGLLY